jgi:predicted RNA-binding protein associated with RNAse of E/G family
MLGSRNRRPTIPLNRLPRGVTIQYRRLPSGIRHFHGLLRDESPNRLVIEQRLPVRNPRREFGRVVVAKGYVGEWFIFRGRWYDVGKFYDRRRRFTGYYCDIIRPVTRLLSNATKTSIITDLFLDLWITPDGRYMVLDEDELDVALAENIISSSLARQARRELQLLIQLTKSGRFPPASIMRIQPLSNIGETG